MANYPACTFCARNDSPAHKEDVLPKWIAREFKFTHWEIKPLHPQPKFKAKQHLGIVTRAPCRRCNNDWLSQLEDAAIPILKPLMRGERRSLGVAEQAIIVQWFLKTIIMYDSVGEKWREPYFTLEERRALCEGRVSVAENTMFFLARYRGDQDIITRELFIPLSLGRRDPESPIISVEGYTATFAIKHLVLQVFSVRRPEDVSETLQFYAPAFEGSCVQIWPLEGSVTMPEFYLDDAGFKLFFERWAHLPRP